MHGAKPCERQRAKGAGCEWGGRSTAAQNAPQREVRSQGEGISVGDSIREATKQLRRCERRPTGGQCQCASLSGLLQVGWSDVRCAPEAQGAKSGTPRGCGQRSSCRNCCGTSGTSRASMSTTSPCPAVAPRRMPENGERGSTRNRTTRGRRPRIRLQPTSSSVSTRPATSRQAANNRPTPTSSRRRTTEMKRWTKINKRGL